MGDRWPVDNAKVCIDGLQTTHIPPIYFLRIRRLDGNKAGNWFSRGRAGAQAASAGGHSEEQSTAARIVEALKRDLINGTLGSETLIVESQIGARFGVSKTPAREALLRLSEMGFVSVIPGKGYTVTKLSWQQIKDLFEVRLLLECLGDRARRCARYLSGRRRARSSRDASRPDRAEHRAASRRQSQVPSHDLEGDAQRAAGAV